MSQPDPTLLQSLSDARAWARAKSQPYFTWLPDAWEPFALDLFAVLVLVAAALTLWKQGAEIWRVAAWVPRRVWYRATGTAPPKSDTEVIRELATDLRALLADRAREAEQAGADLPEDAVDRAVTAAQEILASNDPSKAEAQASLRRGDIAAAETALEDAFRREAAAVERMDDQVQQLRLQAAETARERAALAATRSVAPALAWYRNAADLDPGNPWTQVELARLYQAASDLSAAADAAGKALNASQDARVRAVALSTLGDVLEAQGDLDRALERFQACHDILVKLAAADASNAGLQRDLSVSHERIGDLEETRGNVAAAVQAYEESLVIARSLADRFPDHKRFASDLEITQRRLADLRTKLA